MHLKNTSPEAVARRVTGGMVCRVMFLDTLASTGAHSPQPGVTNLTAAYSPVRPHRLSSPSSPTKQHLLDVSHLPLKSHDSPEKRDTLRTCARCVGGSNQNREQIQYGCHPRHQHPLRRSSSFMLPFTSKPHRRAQPEQHGLPREDIEAAVRTRRRAALVEPAVQNLAF